VRVLGAIDFTNLSSTTTTTTVRGRRLGIMFANCRGPIWGNHGDDFSRCFEQE
jgi:hypothetical protein